MGRVLLTLLLAAVVGAGSYVAGSRSAAPGGMGIPQHAPEAGDPPAVWVTGTLVQATDTLLVLRQGDGPTIRMQRLAETATAGFRPSGGRWVEDPSAIRAGREACIEALLDDGSFVALRVFAGARGCGPA